MNVSVRMDSPGDNGSVEQVNNAASTTETAPQYQPEPPQYQEPIPAPHAPRPRPAPQAPASEPGSAAEGWDWSWEWNCGDAIPEMPFRQDVGDAELDLELGLELRGCDALPTNTVGEKPPQYQPGVTQYRPININISIRINSPGNDGPVHQTNVAVVVTAPALPPIRVEVPAAPTAQLGSASVGFEALVSPASADRIHRSDDHRACAAVRRGRLLLLPEPTGVATAPMSRRACFCRRRRPRVGEISPPASAFSASVAVTSRIAKASEAAARVARPAPKPAQTPSGAAPSRRSDARTGRRAQRRRLCTR